MTYVYFRSYFYLHWQLLSKCRLRTAGVLPKGVIPQIVKEGSMVLWAALNFFPFPSQKKAPKARKRWVELLRREDFDPNKRHRLFSSFCWRQTKDNHPYPELFAYNNYKQSCNPRSARLLSKLCRCRDEEYSTRHTATNTCTDHTEEVPMAMMLVDFPDTDEVGHKIFIPVIPASMADTRKIWRRSQRRNSTILAV